MARRYGVLLAIFLLVAAGAFIGGRAVGQQDHGNGIEVSAYPLPGTQTASPDTDINFRGASANLLTAVKVVGSQTGEHTGRLVPGPADQGVTFVPDHPFQAGEQVDVRTGFDVAGATRGQFSFDVVGAATPGPPPASEATPPAPPPNEPHHFRTRPDLRPPVVDVTTPAHGTAAGDVFMGPKLGAGQWGPLIVDNRGTPIWFDPLPAGQSATDFRVQDYLGHPMLTWWQGHINIGTGQGEGIIANRNYRVVARVRAGDGYAADLHEFQLTPQGTALLTAYRPVHADLSSVGGPANGIVDDSIVQEVDVATGAVLFEWHSIGHVPYSESTIPVPTKPDQEFDYFHVNSIDVEPDGNFLVSARHTSTIYEIDRRTGDILWRLGGKNSDFRMDPGTEFRRQHNVRRQANGDIRIFDNTSVEFQHHSKVLTLSLDQRAHVAHLVRALPAPGNRFAETQGDAQKLPNGDTFAGWGSDGSVSEYGPAGSLLFDAHMPKGYDTYRAYRERWSGRPTAPPDVAAETGRGQLTVWASWNGATGVARWQFLGGAQPGALHRIATVPRSGFETTAVIAPRTVPRYVAVRALGAHGHVLGRSRLVRPQTTG